MKSRGVIRHKTIQKTQPALQELFFIIAPPRHIMSDVSVLKDDVHYLVGKELQDRHTRAHISLFRYTENEVKMKHMLRFVEARASEVEPFNVFLKDFGVFYNGAQRSVYLDIVNKYHIQDLFERIVKEEPAYVPNISIAKSLDHDDFLKCWPYLKSLNYSNQHFLCDRITVLAKTETGWSHYKEIVLGNA